MPRQVEHISSKNPDFNLRFGDGIGVPGTTRNFFSATHGTESGAFSPNTSLADISSFRLKSRPALARSEIWSNPAQLTGYTSGGPDGINAMASSVGVGVGPLTAGNALGSHVAQNQTRPLDVSEVKNGLYDGRFFPRHYPIGLTIAKELYRYVGSSGLPTTSNTAEVHSNGEIEIEQLMNTDLEDWNAFMKNVDDALFEVGLGR
ncbi:hypothetical protein J3R30DRAFT_2400014 [Lentinula aciculospora]|uniref:Uncharacterized protein n=1 Tax=Lentinula aciculospora TaxID=153920 RepID=A0A9W9DQG3_9AGAR|nr:hypothetical protein J3R30DRAFT_2400014 [Lentinula aciculospora]